MQPEPAAPAGSENPQEALGRRCPARAAAIRACPLLPTPQIGAETLFARCDLLRDVVTTSSDFEHARRSL